MDRFFAMVLTGIGFGIAVSGGRVIIPLCIELISKLYWRSRYIAWELTTDVLWIVSTISIGIWVVTNTKTLTTYYDLSVSDYFVAIVFSAAMYILATLTYSKIADWAKMQDALRVN